MLVQPKLKQSAVKAKMTLHCTRGPIDNRAKEASAVEAQDGQRMDRTALGLSIRVGCTVHFAARIQPETEHITEILYYQTEHSDACKVKNAYIIPLLDLSPYYSAETCCASSALIAL